MPLDVARDKWRLFLAAFGVIALLTKTDPGSAHELSRYGTVESLVDRGTFQLDDSSFIGTIDKIYRDGHYYSHQTPLLTVLEAPVYWAINLPGIRFNNRGRFVMTYGFILLTNGLALALTVVAFARLLGQVGVDERVRSWLAPLMIFGTWLLPYGIVSNNHGISAMLVAVLINALLQVRSEGVTNARVIALGGALGVLAAIELLPLVSFVPLTVAYLATHGLSAMGWLRFSAACALPLLVQSIFNVRITGDVIPAGFHHELLSYDGSAFDASSLSGTLKFTSSGAAADYAWTALFAGKGFFTFSPLLLLSLIAAITTWRWWARARGVQLVMVGSIILSLGASIVTTNNYGGEAVGFRHAVYLAPAFLVLLLPWLAATSAMRSLVIGAAALSALSMVLFAVRQPWSALTLSNAAIGSWDQYLPLVGKVVSGNLFNP